MEGKQHVPDQSALAIVMCVIDGVCTLKTLCSLKSVVPQVIVNHQCVQSRSIPIRLPYRRSSSFSSPSRSQSPSQASRSGRRGNPKHLADGEAAPALVVGFLAGVPRLGAGVRASGLLVVGGRLLDGLLRGGSIVFARGALMSAVPWASFPIPNPPKKAWFCTG